ncbi:MAG TPA: type IV conjugative transfer system lipoprotein TraV [Methanothrix sp.]|nr:type IV conjugative transfer system lipoprotein TraV [Methanothrix sp.]
MLCTLSLGLLYGCSANYSCKNKGHYDDPRCPSVSEQYRTTMDKMMGAYQEELDDDDDDDDDDTDSAKKKGRASKSGKKRSSPGDEAVKALKLDVPMPLRLPPRVVRIWIAPWEDSDGDLHQPEYIFTEISNKHGRWIFGERQTIGVQPQLHPLDDQDATQEQQQEQEVTPAAPKNKAEEERKRKQEEAKTRKEEQKDDSFKNVGKPDRQPELKLNMPRSR